jgi:hypothetical protein
VKSPGYYLIEIRRRSQAEGRLTVEQFFLISSAQYARVPVGAFLGGGKKRSLALRSLERRLRLFRNDIQPRTRLTRYPARSR